MHRSRLAGRSASIDRDPLRPLRDSQFRQGNGENAVPERSRDLLLRDVAVESDTALNPAVVVFAKCPIAGLPAAICLPLDGQHIIREFNVEFALAEARKFGRDAKFGVGFGNFDVMLDYIAAGPKRRKLKSKEEAEEHTIKEPADLAVGKHPQRIESLVNAPAALARDRQVVLPRNEFCPVHCHSPKSSRAAGGPRANAPRASGSDHRRLSPLPET